MTAFGARKQETEATTGRASSSRFWSGYPLKRNRSVRQRTVYPELSSSVRANSSVNHRFTAQSFLIPSLTNLWNFCTSESIQATNAYFYWNNVKENHLNDLPLHWLVFLSRIALVDTIFPYLEQQRWELLFVRTGPLVSGTFRTIVIWIKYKPRCLSSDFYFQLAICRMAQMSKASGKRNHWRLIVLCLRGTSSECLVLWHLGGTFSKRSPRKQADYLKS